MTFQTTITCGKGKDSHMYLDIAGGVATCAPQYAKIKKGTNGI